MTIYEAKVLKEGDNPDRLLIKLINYLIATVRGTTRIILNHFRDIHANAIIDMLYMNLQSPPKKYIHHKKKLHIKC